MASAKTNICNYALQNLGIGTLIGDVDTEASQEALACKLVFDDLFKKVLRDFDWNFARKYKALGQIAKAPNSDWGYSFEYPSDCLMPRKIVSGYRNDTFDTNIPFEVGESGSGIVIWCDSTPVTLRYTYLVTVYEKLPSDFVMAFSLLLAGYIAPRVTGSDSFKLGDRALNLYAKFEAPRAMVNSGLEGKPDRPNEAESIQARY